MISRNFYFQVIIRITLITLTSIGFSFLLLTKQYLWSFPLGLLILIQSVFLTKLVNNINRKIAYFFQSIKNDDFALRYPEQCGISSFNNLHKSLNLLNEKIQQSYLKNEAQEKYYQEILKQSDIGIMTINAKGHIVFVNPQMEKLFDHKSLNHIKQLNQLDTNLYNLFSTLKPFERKLVVLTNEREKKQISIKSTALISDDNELLLVVAQDILKELDEKETESWMRLIRVLAHEIMNSIAPITSISDSIIKYYKENGIEINTDQLDNNTIKNTIRGLEVIKEQGNDLMEFVHSYRSLLNLPKPDRSIVPFKRFIDKILILMEPEIKKSLVPYEVFIEPSDLDFFMDEKQLSLVFINLIKNALYSLQNCNNGKLIISAKINSQGNKYIEIIDNGPGIPAESIEDIFIPFFTTKEKGSGVGLSLSKQILQLHGGTLEIFSKPFIETKFILIFDKFTKN